MKRVMFACVGNAMRSQMAEGFARHLARPGTVEVRSGGTNPMGTVHPRAITAMAQVGVDISRHTSKLLDLDFARQADAFITLCGPLDEACPRALAETAIDWTLPDPIHGDEAMLLGVRDEIERRVRGLLTEWDAVRGDA